MSNVSLKLAKELVFHESPQTSPQNSVVEATALAAYLEPFIRQLDITENSRNTYRRCLQRFFAWLCKRSQQEALTKEHIVRYKEYLDAEGLKPFTRSTYLVAVRRFFEWLEAHLIYPNVAKGIKGIRKLTKSHSKDSISKEGVTRLLGKIDRNTPMGTRDFAIIFLLVHTGLRLIEVARALASDIEFAADQNTYLLWVRGKGREGKDSFVVLSAAVVATLEMYLSSRKVKLGCSRKPLFASLSQRNREEALTVFSLSRLIKRRMIKAGIKTRRITAHSLRHTFGVLAIEAGASLYEVQLAMRHLSPQTTQVYLGDIEHKKRLEGSPEKRVSEFLNFEQLKN